MYIGYPSDLNERLKSHNHLATKGRTINFRPLDLVYTEEFLTKAEALKREKKLKSAKGRDEVWTIIKAGIPGQSAVVLSASGGRLSVLHKKALLRALSASILSAWQLPYFSILTTNCDVKSLLYPYNMI
ncbi:GIY-YIG nuclease family protein [Daejeonella lutea]|uniref:GIY-YIG nuclease family protein n=1 Tax=Daejeonella lutea TaxID=572036 RepID=UPI002936DADF|nr:GIY-YIG nuclease family protein [Daejeonella lutea]